MRIRADDGIQTSNWSTSGLFSIGGYNLPNDSNKFYIKNDQDEKVAWFGELGNIILKGSCILSPNCNNPSDGSFIFENENSSIVAYIDYFGNLCVESGSCDGFSQECNPDSDAFIIRNSQNENMSYIDFNGELCLKGGVYEDVLFIE